MYHWRLKWNLKFNPISFMCWFFVFLLTLGTAPSVKNDATNEVGIKKQSSHSPMNSQGQHKTDSNNKNSPEILTLDHLNQQIHGEDSKEDTATKTLSSGQDEEESDEDSTDFPTPLPPLEELPLPLPPLDNQSDHPKENEQIDTPPEITGSQKAENVQVKATDDDFSREHIRTRTVREEIDSGESERSSPAADEGETKEEALGSRKREESISIATRESVDQKEKSERSHDDGGQQNYVEGITNRTKEELDGDNVRHFGSKSESVEVDSEGMDVNNSGTKYVEPNSNKLSQDIETGLGPNVEKTDNSDASKMGDPSSEPNSGLKLDSGTPSDEGPSDEGERGSNDTGEDLGSKEGDAVHSERVDNVRSTNDEIGSGTVEGDQGEEAKSELGEGVVCGELGCIGEGDKKEEEEEVMTFEEFKRKMMEQEEGQALQRPVEDVHSMATGSKKTAVGNTNYATSDCGAKVIQTNREAQNSMAILLENKDVYMINPCSANIFFVVELCEMVSIRTLEIACFELFSSIPKSFKVYSSDSYPDTEWIHRGTFEASNERKIHSFSFVAHENIYAKFIKVEMQSFYGSEHYCPLSLLRVLGASMMEVYEESQRKSHAGKGPPSIMLPPSEGFGEDDALLRAGMDSEGDENDTLFGTAKDVVLGVLKKPLSLFGKIMKADGGEGDPSEAGSETGSPPRAEQKEPLEGGTHLQKGKTVGGGVGGKQEDMIGAGEPQRGESLKDSGGGSTVVGDSVESGKQKLAGNQDLGKVEETRLQSTSEEFKRDHTGTVQDMSSAGDVASKLDSLQNTLNVVSPSETADICNKLETGEGPTSDVGPEPGGRGEDPPHLSRTIGSGFIDPAPVQGTCNGIQEEFRSGSRNENMEATISKVAPLMESNDKLKPNSIPTPMSRPNSIPPLGPEETMETMNENAKAEKLLQEPFDVKASKGDLESDSVSIHSKSSVEIENSFDEVCDGLEGGRLASSNEVTEASNLPMKEVSASSESASNSMELMTQRLAGSEHTPTGDPIQSGRDESNTPLWETDARDNGPGVGRGPEDSDIAQWGMEVAAVRSTVSSPAASETQDRGISDTTADPVQIPGANSPHNSNTREDSASLGNQAGSNHGTLLPHTASFAVQNATANNSRNNATTSGNSSNITVGSSDVHGANTSNSDFGTGIGVIDDGNRTLDLNSSEVHGGNGSNTTTSNITHTDNGNHTSLVRNQTEMDSNRNGNQTGNGFHSGMPSQQREKSVFLRLSNHIEDLQTNMTLFTIFLDQISSSLKKNKNKTNETTKWLDKRITSLNESILVLKGNITSKLEMMSELRSDILEVMKALSTFSHGFFDWKMEISSIILVVSLLQITLIFFFLVFCLWHCYSHHSLAKQISALQQHKVTPTTNKNIELVGSKESSKAVAMDNSFSVLPSSIKNVKSIGHLRSSSTSRLSELDDSSKLLKSTISGSNFIAMNSRGSGSGGVARLLRTGSEGQEGIQFLGSSSTSSIQDTIFNDWKDSKKRKKSKSNKK